MKPLSSAFIIATAAVLLGAGSAAAQRVELRGRGDIENDLFLRTLIASGDYTLFVRDTVIARADTVRGTALMALGTIRIDGTITGDLIIVDANVFIRPGARILGRIRNVAGGLYPSELAVVEGGTHSEPNAPYRATQLADGRVVITGQARARALALPGIAGLRIPTYDRVDGLTLSFGPTLALPRIERIEPELRPRIDYRSQRGAITGGIELGLPRGRTELALGAERTTLTNERWIRSDLNNTVSYFFMAKDLRDYYEADRAYAELRRALEVGPRTTSAFLRAQLEDARSLRAGSPWTVTGTPRTDNLPVDSGRISSAVAGVNMLWSLPLHVVEIDGGVEAAARALGGDHGFTRYVLDTDWAMAALRDHTLRIQTHFQGPLPGTDSLPPQRWSFVGGSSTLQTFEIAEFRGDRVAFVETEYSVPLPPREGIRFIGRPPLDLLHAVGMAWTHEQSRRFEQNVGARLRFTFVNFRVLTNPRSFGDDVKFSVGLHLPRGAYPWERRDDQ
jgi:hypothetical protein